jgi:uncharacterized protein (TIGR02646 family)
MVKLIHPECPNPQALASDYAFPANKDALRIAASGKCMYCESKIDASGAQIEHIKPKSKYPKLEFTWENLGYVCQACNRTKWDKYDESTPFVNPYKDDPQKFIEWNEAMPYARADSKRGASSIKEIGLDRPGLVRARQNKLKKIRTALILVSEVKNSIVQQKMIEEIKNEALPTEEYSAAVKAYLIKEGVL